MSKYEMNTILSMWAQDKLTVEQAVGQILQHLQALLGRVGQVEKQVEQLRRQETVVSVVTRPAMVPETVVEPPAVVEELVEDVALEEEVGGQSSEVSETSEDSVVVPDDAVEATPTNE
jgi:hypothetical protein